MMLFHGDADANVPYNVIRESGVGFFGSKYIAGQLRAMNLPVLFLFGRERLTRHRHGADGRQPGCDRCFPLETRRG